MAPTDTFPQPPMIAGNVDKIEGQINDYSTAFARLAIPIADFRDAQQYFMKTE